MTSRDAQTYTLKPIAHVRSQLTEHDDDCWGGVISTIQLTPDLSASTLQGLEAFSHLEIIFLMDQVEPQQVETGARHPRNNPAWPQVGIFAQRARRRPNRLGLSVCRLISVEGATLTVAELDALDGTPIMDIKPYMQELAPRHEVRQPQWSHELMSRYYASAADE